jgi:hypothetical protein
MKLKENTKGKRAKPALGLVRLSWPSRIPLRAAQLSHCWTASHRSYARVSSRRRNGPACHSLVRAAARSSSSRDARTGFNRAPWFTSRGLRGRELNHLRDLPGSVARRMRTPPPSFFPDINLGMPLPRSSQPRNREGQPPESPASSTPLEPWDRAESPPSPPLLRLNSAANSPTLVGGKQIRRRGRSVVSWSARCLPPPSVSSPSHVSLESLARLR